jgi:hypothetical protein
MPPNLPPGARWAIRVAHYESTRPKRDPRVRPTLPVIREAQQQLAVAR